MGKSATGTKTRRGRGAARGAVLALAAGALALTQLGRRGGAAHPDLRRAAAVLPREIMSRRTLPVFRALGALAPESRDVEVIRIDEHVTVRVHRPASADLAAPALLWAHGGGYVIGSAAQDDALCRRFAERLGIVVAAVDYRLAPEHPYPAPLEDCYAALEWLTRAPGVDPARVAIGGASAGAGLTAALAIAARDRGEIAPVLQLLAYPMLDDRAAEPGPVSAAHRLWSHASNRFGWRSYLGDADPETAVPARAADLGGVAPAWMGVGTHDLFHAEDLAYARRLRESGVPCEVVEVPGAFHGFDQVLPGVPVSRAFFGGQCEALRAAFGS